jgi:hypothetical protein
VLDPELHSRPGISSARVLESFAMRLCVRAAALVVAGVVASGPATARPARGEVRADRHILLGVLGDRERFDRLTGQRTRVGHVIVGWGQGPIAKILDGMGETPMLGIGTGGRLTPQDIALGRGDSFLVELNQAVAARAGLVYVRPLPEMNGHWNDYCAYLENGAPRGPAYSTAVFRKAFARIYLLVHGGSVARVNAKLRRLGLPAVSGGGLATNTTSHVRVVWNPQGYGSPDLPGNSAAAYYPGNAYVDVVADDLYNIRGKAEWAANDALYAAHPGKPYAIAEWANWGIDDPSFVTQMAEFAHAHPRLELLAYYNGKAGSLWDLARQPRTRAAYRTLIDPLGR